MVTPAGRLALTGGVLVGVPEGGTVRVPVMVPVGLLEGVPVAVADAVAVVDELAPLVTEAEALPEGDVAEVGVPEDDRVDVCSNMKQTKMFTSGK